MAVRRLSVVVMTICVFVPIARAYDPVAPYAQAGWVTVDRWGGTYLCYRDYVIPVSKDLWSRFLPYRDKLVHCVVEKLRHSIHDPGPWRIDAVRELNERAALHDDVHPVKLQANVSQRVNTTEVIFQLLVAYDGTGKKRVQLDHMTLVIVRKKDTSDAPELTFTEDHRITDGPSYLFLNRNLAYEALREPTDPLKLTVGGMRVTSEHPFDWFIVFRKALPPAEYEAWLMYHDPNLAEDIGTRSNTIGFSVVPRPRKGQREESGAPNH
jgi:hypothetical protein